jgi:hypothetical protein
MNVVFEIKRLAGPAAAKPSLRISQFLLAFPADLPKKDLAYCENHL